MKAMQLVKSGLKSYAKCANVQALVQTGKSELKSYLNYTGMKTAMRTVKDDLKDYVKRSGMKAASGMEDTNRKRMMGVLVQRQADALDLLDCVKTKAEMPSGMVEAKKNAKDYLISSPLFTLLFSLSVICFTAIAVCSVRPEAFAPGAPVFVNNHWKFILLFALLIAGQSIYRLVRRAKTAAHSQPQPEARLLLDVDVAKVQLEKQLSRFMNDSEAVCGMFQSQQLDGMNAYEDELVKLYASLYEAKVDLPECEEFNYSLTMAEVMLRQIGLKTVAYSEERKALFNIDVEDYRDEMRFPAIVREKTGEVVRKGEYIQNRDKNA